jgi:hypothetical protein
MKSRTVIAGVAGAILLSSIAVEVAAKKTPPPGPFKVAFAGCPIMHDIEGGCLTVKSKGTTYEINSIKSQVDLAKHLGIAGTGTWYPGQGTTCMMGKPLSKIQWHYTRQRCLGG